MNPTQLDDLKRALRRQWEAEQEIARIEKEMMFPDSHSEVHPSKETPSASPVLESIRVSRPEKIMVSRPNSPSGEKLSVPRRVLQYFKANKERVIRTREVVQALADVNPGSVRSAINKMIGNQIAQATDAEGNVRREFYVFRRDDND